jgi:hypothetical protein
MLGADTSQLLDAEPAGRFHTCVAKLLFAAKRVRPDVMLNTSLGCSKALCPTENDQKNLTRVLKYLKGTADRGIIFRGGGNTVPETFGDAAYMVHEDCKSRGGVLTQICSGTVGSSASKLSILCKSSTEAELVNLDKAGSKAIEIRRFIMGYDDETVQVVVYQDNKSVLQMIKNGRPMAARTKHIAMKYFSICEYVESGAIILKWLSTEEMLADILTKPLTGAIFLKFRDILCPIIIIILTPV